MFGSPGVGWACESNLCNATRAKQALRIGLGIPEKVLRALRDRVRRTDSRAPAVDPLVLPRRTCGTWSRLCWKIENCVHSARDTTLGEDACWVRKGSLPRIMVAFANLASRSCGCSASGTWGGPLTISSSARIVPWQWSGPQWPAPRPIKAVQAGRQQLPGSRGTALG